MTIRKANLLYKFMQGCYWMMYCACYAFVVYYLTENGFSAKSVGVIAAVFGVASTIVQPVFGRIADRSATGWKKPIFFLSVGVLAVNVLLLLFRDMLLQGALFGISLIMIGILMPLVNTVCFTCTEAGDDVDFGSARGIGSLTYAGVAFAGGQLSVVFGSGVIPIGQCLFSLLMIALVLVIPYHAPKKQEASVSAQASETKRESIFAFFKRYPGYLTVWLGSLMLMIFHCMTNTYMLHIVQRVGCGSDAMGNVNALEAVLELPVMFLFSKIMKRFSVHSLLLVSGIGFLIKSVLYYTSTGIMGVYAAQIFQLISYAIFANVVIYYAVDRIDPKDYSFSQSLITVTMSAGTFLGSLMGGFFVDELSTSFMLLSGLVAAAIGAVFMAVNYRNFRKRA